MAPEKKTEPKKDSGKNLFGFKFPGLFFCLFDRQLNIDFKNSKGYEI